MKSINETNEQTGLNPLFELEAKVIALDAVMDALVFTHPDRKAIRALLQHEVNQLREDADQSGLGDRERGKRLLASLLLEKCIPPPPAENDE